MVDEDFPDDIIPPEEEDRVPEFDVLEEFLKLFGQRSYYNEIPGEILCRILLNLTIMKDKVLTKGNGKKIPFLTHMFFIQDSGCLDQATKIRTKQGKKSLDNLSDTFEVRSYNHSKKTQQWSQAYKIDSGEKELFEIELENGKKVTASADHIFFDKDSKEIRVSSLKPRDDIMVYDNPRWTPEQKQISSERFRKIKQGSTLDVESKLRMGQKGRKRWQNPIWKAQEMQRRKCLIESGNYKERAKKSRLKTKGISFEDRWGKEKADEKKRKISENLRKNNPMSNETIRKKHLQIMKKLHASGRIPYFKKGKENVSYGIPRYPHLRFVPELGHPVRSTWEEQVARKLQEKNIPYQYEGKSFSIGEYTYHPDFITDKAIIEVKGAVSQTLIDKYKKFCSLYPQLNFVVLASGKNVLTWKQNGFDAFEYLSDDWVRKIQC
jgi:hypothetical protein